MKRHLVRQEWMLLRHNATLLGVAVLLLALMVVAAFNGAARVGQVSDLTSNLNQGELQTQEALKNAVARYEADPSGDPPAAANAGSVGISILGHYAILPPGPLAPLAIGQSDIQQTYYRVTANARHTFMNTSEIRNPLNVMSGSFDVAFVIVFLVPVFIIALTFDLLSREKERGILGLTMAHGVPLRAYIVSKALAIGVIIVVILGISAAATLYIIDADFSDPNMWVRLLFWSAVVLLYSLFWFVLALLVNSFNKASVTNGVILANLWLVLVVVLPAAVNLAATTIYPAPSRVSLTTELREAASEAEEEAAQTREAFFFDHPEMAGEDANPDEFFVQVLATDAAVEESIAPIVESFAEQAEKRDAAVDALQFLSPAIMAQQALNAVSETNPETFAAFEQQTLAFHDQWRGFYRDKILVGEPMRAADFDAIPQFEFQGRGLGGLIADLAGPLIGLTVVVIVLGLWAARRLDRYPIA